MADIGELKLVFDNEPMPILMPEQVAKIPSIVLNKLIGIASRENSGNQMQELGQLTVLTINSLQPDDVLMVKIAIQWIQHGDNIPASRSVNIQVHGRGRHPVKYQPKVHADDLNITSTSETNRHFCARVKLYILAVQSESNDLKFHLSQELRSLFPVYAAEVTFLLERFGSANIMSGLQESDPELARFIGGRMHVQRDKLAANGFTTAYLLGCFSSIDKGLSFVMSHAKDAVLEISKQPLLNSIASHLQAGPFLDAYIQTLDPDGTTSAPNNHNAGITSKEANEEEAASRLQKKSVTAGGVYGRSGESTKIAPAPNKSTTASKKAVTSRANPTIASQTIETTTAPSDSTPSRPRRARPSAAHFDYSSRNTHLTNMTLARPLAEGQYWSADERRWKNATADRKRLYSHAHYMCETDLGFIDPNQCTNCRDQGITCDRYVDELITRFVGRKCAACKLQCKVCETPQGN